MNQCEIDLDRALENSRLYIQHLFGDVLTGHPKHDALNCDAMMARWRGTMALQTRSSDPRFTVERVGSVRYLVAVDSIDVYDFGVNVHVDDIVYALKQGFIFISFFNACSEDVYILLARRQDSEKNIKDLMEGLYQSFQNFTGKTVAVVVFNFNTGHYSTCSCSTPERAANLISKVDVEYENIGPNPREERQHREAIEILRFRNQEFQKIKDWRQVKPNNDYSIYGYWIDPLGRIHAVGQQQHWAFICEFYEQPALALLDGWVRVTRYQSGAGITYKFLTSSTERALKKIKKELDDENIPYSIDCDIYVDPELK